MKTMMFPPGAGMRHHHENYCNVNNAETLDHGGGGQAGNHNHAHGGTAHYGIT